MNIRVMFGPLSDGWPFVGSERCLKKRGSVSTHAPPQAPLRAHEGALSTRPQSGACIERVLRDEISGFEVDSSRSYAKWILESEVCWVGENFLSARIKSHAPPRIKRALALQQKYLARQRP